MTPAERFEEALAILCDGILNPGVEDNPSLLFDQRVANVRSVHAACVEEARRIADLLIREGAERERTVDRKESP